MKTKLNGRRTERANQRIQRIRVSFARTRERIRTRKRENCQIDCRSIGGAEGPFCIRNVVVSLSRLWPRQRGAPNAGKHDVFLHRLSREEKEGQRVCSGTGVCMGPETRRKEREKVGVGRMQCTGNVREREREKEKRQEREREKER